MTLNFRAVTYTDRNLPLQITETQLPVTEKDGKYEIESTKILVKVQLAAINPVDNFLRSITLPYLFRSPKGYGFDYSGDIVAIGSGAEAKTNLHVGDAVCGLNRNIFAAGTLSEFILVDPFGVSGRTIVRKPETLSYQQAAAYPLVFGTAQTMFDQVDKNPKKVLILGAGTSVGRYLVQLAKQVYGAEEIVVTCSGKTEETAKNLGATLVIDYTVHKTLTVPVLESVKATGKFNAIFDAAGNGDLFGVMEEIIVGRKDGGTYVTVVGDVKPVFKDGMFTMLVANFASQVRAVRSLVHLLPYKYVFHMLEPESTWAAKLALYFAEKDIKVFVDSTYKFEDFQKGIDRMVLNKAQGKVVIDIQ